MGNNLFRRNSLERISSPEQLNEYIRVTNPGIWLILIGFFAILIAVGIWAFTGTIPETVRLTGAAYSDKQQEADMVFCYVPLSVSKKLSEGMSVQISPDYAPREEYGYIFGLIQRIGDQPVTDADILETFGNMNYVQGIVPAGVVVEIRVIMEKNENGKLKWSNQGGESIVVSNGSHCNILVVIKDRKPYELVFK